MLIKFYFTRKSHCDVSYKNLYRYFSKIIDTGKSFPIREDKSRKNAAMSKRNFPRYGSTARPGSRDPKKGRSESNMCPKKETQRVRDEAFRGL